MTQTAIEVNNVWKKFRKGEIHDSLRDLIPAAAKRLIGRGAKSGALSDREFWALRDVTFEVKRGDSIGIIGPNGAGKSTMLKLLSRIIKPNRGSYKVNGRLSALIEVGAGFHSDLTGRENIYLNGTILGMAHKEIRTKEDQIIDFAGVESFIDTPVKRYSSGMKARLGFAVAAHMEPDVLLVDEVLSVGDAKFRSKCIHHMRELIRSDVTVVFISHLLDQVRKLCPNTVVLDQGAVVYNGATDGAIGKYMEVLSESDKQGSAEKASEAEIQNARLCDTEGNEVLEWKSGQPGVIAFDLVIHQALGETMVMINLSSIGGVYLGTINSHLDGVTLPNQPGRYAMRFTLDPMPLNDGDFQFQFVITDVGRHRVWDSRNPRTVSVRGGNGVGMLVRCEGSWEQVGEETSAVSDTATV